MKEILITSSVLIAVLLVLRVIFAKKVSRVLIYSAWGLVALRLLIPVQIGQIDFSILTSAKPVTEAITQIEQRPVSGQTKEEVYQDIVADYIEKDQTVFIPEVQEQIKQEISQGTASREEIFDKIQQARPNQEIFVPEVQQQVQQQVEETADPITMGQIAAIVWLAGVAVMAVWFMIVNLRHSRMLRKNREKLDCEGTIPVYVSERVGSPCLAGLFRPAIYLTPECAASEETRRHVLTHELTHYRHMDHIWSVVRCVCLCAYWFDPLVWVAAWFSRRDCELACDEGALKRLGEGERIAYGKSLLDVVSHASTPANLMQTATAMNETKKQLKERVNFIVKKPKISLIAAICMVIVCAIVAGCAAAGPANMENPTTDPKPSDPVTSTTQLKPTEPDDGTRIVQLTTKGGWPVRDTYIYVYADEALTQKLETIRTDETGVATYAGETGVTYYMVADDYYMKADGFVPAPYYVVSNTVTELLVDTKLKGSSRKDLGEVMCEIDCTDWKGNQFQLSKVIEQGKPCLIWCVDKETTAEKMTIMQAIYNNYGDKLEILMYTTQEGQHFVKKMAEEMVITFPITFGGQFDPEWVIHREIMVVDRYGMLALRDFESGMDLGTMQAIAAYFTSATYRQNRVFSRGLELLEYVETLKPMDEVTYRLKMVDDTGAPIVGVGVGLGYPGRVETAVTNTEGIAEWTIKNWNEVYIVLPREQDLPAYRYDEGEYSFADGSREMTITLERRPIVSYTVKTVDPWGNTVSGIPLYKYADWDTQYVTDENGLFQWEDYEREMPFSIVHWQLPEGYVYGGYTQEGNVFTLLLRPIVTYTIKVVDENGNPMQNMHVGLISEQDSDSERTDANGEVRLKLGENSYTVKISNIFRMDDVDDRYDQVFQLPMGQTEATFVWVDEIVTYKFKVVDKDGNPIAGLDIDVLMEQTNAMYYPNAKTDKNGEATIRMRKGKHKVSVTRIDWDFSGEGETEQWLYGTFELDDEQTDITFVVGEPEKVENP